MLRDCDISCLFSFIVVFINYNIGHVTIKIALIVLNIGHVTIKIALGVLQCKVIIVIFI